MKSTAAFFSRVESPPAGRRDYHRPNRPTRFRRLALSLATGVALLAPSSHAGPAVVTALPGFGSSEGNDAHVVLIQGREGKIYGTTSVGSDHGYGAVFELTPTGALASMHALAANAKEHGAAHLVSSADGTLYGVLQNERANWEGGIFKLTSTGDFTPLHEFKGSTNRADGAFSVAALVQGRDGNFYGTSTSGGKFEAGTVFMMTPDGTVSVLHSFAGPDGNQPAAALLLGNDGNFYGSTKVGGEDACGNIFKITSQGEFTVLHTFKKIENNNPGTPLIQGRDGNFYGTTASTIVQSPNHDCGSIFKLTPTGVFTTLHEFHSEGGSYPSANTLTLGDDGEIYGTTIATADLPAASIFRLTREGTYTTLHVFRGHRFDRGVPREALVRGSAGRFYGTTDNGTVFQLANSAAGPLTADDSVEAGPLLEMPSTGSGGSVSDGVLTYKDDRRGRTSTLKVFRLPFPSAQVANALTGSTGSWVWISDAGDQSLVLSVADDGKVAVNPVPIQMALVMRTQAGAAPR